MRFQVYPPEKTSLSLSLVKSTVMLKIPLRIESAENFQLLRMLHIEVERSTHTPSGNLLKKSASLKRKKLLPPYPDLNTALLHFDFTTPLQFRKTD